MFSQIADLHLTCDFYTCLEIIKINFVCEVQLINSISLFQNHINIVEYLMLELGKSVYKPKESGISLLINFEIQNRMILITNQIFQIFEPVNSVAKLFHFRFIN
ncbi:hypothetical protein BpHYR1_001915 [Brachionus plicatilis]|uniref:Uncharacterized protein n=1 Tax=Brachionus plicatilis TaxID=10195 RepID=A0A3M7SCQ1_BRAPC|nr:hypothetical protein BpHYR1_001915 [Brachionus plicatilis]